MADTAVLVADTAVLVADTAVLLADTAVLVADTAVLMFDTAALVADTAVLVADTAALVADTAVLVANNSCPSGSWQEFEGSCYLVVENYSTWEEAEIDCNFLGGHLASIHTAAERNFVNSLVPSNIYHIWLGGTDAAVEVQYT
jgi:hypothetical protein